MSAERDGIATWDDVPARRLDRGDLGGTGLRIGHRAGAVRVGLTRYLVPAGARPMPVHAHVDEEEIFHVLAGEGRVLIGERAYAVGPGDTIVHRAGGPEHTIGAGATDLDVLAFASGSDTGLTFLPRPGVFWAGRHWIPADGPHPFDAEVACGPLTFPELTAERPPEIAALADAPVRPNDRDGYRGRWHLLGEAAGSQRSGLRRVVLEPGQMSAPPHWHGQEEELFVVLEGDGELLLVATDRSEARTPIAAGDVIARPPASGQGHALIAGAGGLTYLAYGTRCDGEIVYYPRSRKAYLGPVMVRVEPADYWDGEA